MKQINYITKTPVPDDPGRVVILMLDNVGYDMMSAVITLINAVLICTNAADNIFMW